MNDSRDSFYRASGSSPPMADAKVNPGSGARWKRTSMFVDGNIYFPIELLGGLAVLSAMVDGADTLHSLGHDFVNIDWITSTLLRTRTRTCCFSWSHTFE